MPEMAQTYNHELLRRCREQLANIAESHLGWVLRGDRSPVVLALMADIDRELATADAARCSKGADVQYRITEAGTFYYPQNENAFQIMRPLLCVVVQPSDDHETFTNAFPTLKLSKE